MCITCGKQRQARVSAQDKLFGGVIKLSIFALYQNNIISQLKNKTCYEQSRID